MSTPIGNIRDLSPRARVALTTADAILCEDTRRTASLLHQLRDAGEGAGTRAKLYRFDDFSSKAAVEHWISRLSSRTEHIALCSDAGTPNISDPGANLVRKCHQHGIPVIPIPGVSAVTTLLAVAGFVGENSSFQFRGFFPRTKSDQARELARFLQLTRKSSDVGVWFESPRRILAALSLVVSTLSHTSKGSIMLVVGKELTKTHEKLFVDTSSDTVDRLEQVYDKVRQEVESQGEVGEWCFAIHFGRHSRQDATTDQSPAWHKTLMCMLDAQVPISTCYQICKSRYTSHHQQDDEAQVPFPSRHVFYDYALQMKSDNQ